MARSMALVLAVWMASSAPAAESVLGDGENLARGCPVAWSRPPDYRPDDPAMCTDAGDRAQLTDGVVSERQWWDRRTVGWDGGQSLTLTVDLGAVCPISAVRVRFEGAWHAGVRYPDWLCAFTSDEGKVWHPVGRWRNEDYYAELRDAPYQVLGFAGLKAAGRLVALVMKPDGRYLMMDEIEVIAGEHAPGEAVHDPAAALAGPWVVDLYFRDEVYVSPQFAVAVCPYRAAVLDVYLPDGVTVAAADGRSSPEAVHQPRTVPPGRRYSYPDGVSTLYLSTTWPVGREGDLYLVGRPGTQKLRLRSIAIPAAPRARRLLLDVDWSSVEYKRLWPGFFDFWTRVGLNTVSLLKTDTAAAAPDADIDGFVAEAKRRGLSVVANYSPFYEGLQRASKALPEPQRLVNLEGKPSVTMCPRLYFDRYYETELAELRRGIAHGATSVWLDFEPDWGASGPACFCPYCLNQFRAFLKGHGVAEADPRQFELKADQEPKLHALWERFQGEFGAAFVRRIRTELSQALTKAGGSGFSLGIYDVSPLWQAEKSRFYHHFVHAGELRRAGLIDCYMPSLYHRVRERVGEAIGRCRDGTSTPIVPWLGIRYGGEEWRYALMETFAAGAAGFTYFTARHLDGRDYATLADVLRQVVPLEDVILDGQPITAAEATAVEPGRVAGMMQGGRMLLLVTNYWQPDHGPVTVRLPAGGTVTALDDGRTVPLTDHAFQADLTRSRRALMYEVRLPE